MTRYLVVESPDKCPFQKVGSKGRMICTYESIYISCNRKKSFMKCCPLSEHCPECEEK